MKEKTMEEKRAEFVRRVTNGEKSKSALCREYGISRPCGDLWLARAAAGEPFHNRSRAPHNSPQRLPDETVALILAERAAHPAMGARKIAKRLEMIGHHRSPAYSTINEILHQHHLITPEASAATTPYARFEKPWPNILWQMDFKGHFLLTEGMRSHPLTILDDHSRYCLCLDSKEDEQRTGVCASLEKVFLEHGLPHTLLCDNGTPWGNSQTMGYTKIDVWLMGLGIFPCHIRAKHPQTQGKDERFNGTLKAELLRFKSFANHAEAQAAFQEFRHFYNYERPHRALNLATPASRYEISRRAFPREIKEWEYEAGTEVRSVKRTGFVSFGGQGFFLSEALGGKKIGLCPSKEKEGVYNVFYRQFRVAQYDQAERVVLSRRVYDPHRGKEEKSGEDEVGPPR
jgi:transposase InsO family protein